MKFVIVEDEIRIREGIKRLLLKLNKDYVVSGEAENGKIALDLIREVEPDIVITDIKMPVMDGLEMLQQLSEEGIRVKAIVLSAYSEFEYARKAMRLGVTEYLLKPIALKDFMGAIENVKQQILREDKEKPEQLGTLKQVLRGIVGGEVQPDAEVLDFMEKKYRIYENTPIALLLYYLPRWEEETVKKTTWDLELIMSGRQECSYCIWKNREQKILCLAIYHYPDKKDLKHWLQSCLLRKTETSAGKALGWIESENILSLKEQYERIFSFLDWNIALGDNVMISYPEIIRVQTSVCVYPMELENQMKTAVCNNSDKPLNDCLQRFHQYFQGERLYEPKNIKECYIRFFWSLINYAKEMRNFNEQGMEQQALLEKIMGARTMLELQEVAEMIVKRVEYKEDDIDNMLIKRTVSMIHEFYQSGITLDEIAQKFKVTPEYLGTRFYKELGMNFSTYIKDYRIGKAKELLLGTNMRIYEIAEKTGYSDSKYFSKVFREATGQLPKEYRMTHK